MAAAAPWEVAPDSVNTASLEEPQEYAFGYARLQNRQQDADQCSWRILSDGPGPYLFGACERAFHQSAILWSTTCEGTRLHDHIPGQCIEQLDEICRAPVRDYGAGTAELPAEFLDREPQGPFAWRAGLARSGGHTPASRPHQDWPAGRERVCRESARPIPAGSSRVRPGRWRERTILADALLHEPVEILRRTGCSPRGN